VLAEHRVGSTLTRNELEEAFLAICRAVELPPDAVNVWIAFPDGGGAEADFLYRAPRPGRQGRRPRPAHDPQGVQRRPPARSAPHAARLARRAVTWQQVTFEPAYVAATLRGLLNR